MGKTEKVKAPGREGVGVAPGAFAYGVYGGVWVL